MSNSIRELVEALLVRFPAIRLVYNEHLTDNEGELLPHLFCGDLTRWMISLYSRGNDETGARQLLTALLDFFEIAFRESDENVKELIAVSILENFPSTGEENYDIRNLLGPELTEELQRVNW